MDLVKKINPMVRAIAVIGAVMALATGATFAALNTQATLTGNTIGTASANADLLLWDGDSFEPTAPGFNFTNIDPGEESEKFNFYFKNNGNVDLDLTAKINAIPSLTAGLSADDVTLNFYGSCDDEPVHATLTELLAGVELPCNPLDEGAQGVIGEEDNDANYAVSVTVDESVELSEDGEEVGAFDIIFDGAAATPAPVTSIED